jgi:hypothetical protein
LSSSDEEDEGVYKPNTSLSFVEAWLTPSSAKKASSPVPDAPVTMPQPAQ